MPLFSKVVSNCDPGKKYKHPFSIVASSNAIQIDNALRSEKDQKGVSRCHDVGFAHGRLNKAWSCHILMPSTPASSAAILPILASSISLFTFVSVCHRLSN